MHAESLASAWTKLIPVMADLKVNYPLDIFPIKSLQFRGFNPRSVNSPKGSGEIELWINIGKNTFHSALLLEKHKALLLEVWSELLIALGDKIDRVKVAPIGGTFYIPGIYLSSVDINDSMPFFQLA